MKMQSIPRSQWAQVFTGEESPVCRRIPVETPGPSEVLVSIHHVGLCHSDLSLWKGEWPLKPKPGLVAGHEGAGIVAAVGSSVKSFKVGDRVGLMSQHGPCGHCESCDHNDKDSCATPLLLGSQAHGAFQQYRVCNATSLARIPDGLSLEAATPIMCAGLTVYAALKKSGAKPGQLVAIMGAGGGLGTMACRFAKAMGMKVLAISSGEKKRQTCLNQLGADYFADYKSLDLARDIDSTSSGRPHAVIITSTQARSLGLAVQCVRTRGTIVSVGLPATSDSGFNCFEVVAREITIHGSFLGTVQDAEDALRLSSKKNMGIPVQSFSFLDLPKGVARMQESDRLGRVVLKVPPTSADAVDLALCRSPPRVYGTSNFQPSKYKVGSYLAHRLETLGAKHIFTVPGDFSLTLLDRLIGNPALQMINCCNELNAGYAADGYARSSPTGVAVVVTTYMVGSLSLANAIAGAYSERIKVIVISGGLKAKDYITRPRDPVHHTLEAKHNNQPLNIFREITCVAVRLKNGNDIESLDHALRECLKKSLPVFIEIPKDIVDDECMRPKPLDIAPTPINPPLSSLQEVMDTFIDLVDAAKRPIVFVGGLARQYLSRDVLTSLISKLNIPTFVLPDGKSLVPESHPHFSGVFWAAASDPDMNRCVMDSDLWITVGAQWTDTHTVAGTLDIDKESGRILDLNEMRVALPNGRTFHDIPLEYTVNALLALEIPTAFHQQQTPEAPCINGHIPNQDHLLQVSHVRTSLEGFLEPSDTLFAETGDSWFNGSHVKLPDGADFQLQFLYGSNGWGLPATFGSQMARPGGRSVLLVGDGAFQMSGHEISTMLRFRANAVIIIMNNLGYGFEAALHDGPYNTIGNWDYTQFARSFSTRGHVFRDEYDSLDIEELMFTVNIRTSRELSYALARAKRERTKLAVIECCLHPEDTSSTLQRFCSTLKTRGGRSEEEHVLIPTKSKDEILVNGAAVSPPYTGEIVIGKQLYPQINGHTPSLEDSAFRV